MINFGDDLYVPISVAVGFSFLVEEFRQPAQIFWPDFDWDGNYIFNRREVAITVTGQD